jgi:ABC-type transport system involved in multi-copper enzyme maturation permease subunit
MRWTVAVLLRPITFALAIVAAVVTGNRSDSFWLGLLAFFIAMGAGRVLGALIRGRAGKAVYKAIWPGAATGFAFLFAAVGLPAWANFFVTVVAASMTKTALAGLLPRQRMWRRVEWRRIDLDELLP